MPPSDSPPRLRALTFLAPGIPLEFFRLVCDGLEAALGCEIELRSEQRISGPMHGDSDPFAEGAADLGFLCSPSFLYLRSLKRPSVELVPAGFVFADERTAGQAVYFSEVVVRRDSPAQRFADLAGTTWGFNDDCSLSGHFATLQKLADLGCRGEYFGHRVHTGSHKVSMEKILRGEIDGAAIDSTVLARARRQRPELLDELRVLESWGPFPIQPIVLRSELAAEWAAPMGEALIGMHREFSKAPGLEALGLEACVRIDEAHYLEERQALCALGEIGAVDGRGDPVS